MPDAEGRGELRTVAAVPGYLKPSPLRPERREEESKRQSSQQPERQRKTKLLRDLRDRESNRKKDDGTGGGLLVVVLPGPEAVQDLPRRGGRPPLHHGVALRVLRLPQVRAQGVRAAMVRREGEHPLRDLPPARCFIVCQNFEPGYTVPPKKAQPADVAVTIRESLEVPRLDYEPSAEEDAALVAASDPEYAECARAASRSASWCRSVAVTFTIVLLLRHLVTVATVGAANQFAFSLLTVYLLRASGILLPFYVVMRLISVIQQGQRQYRLQLLQEQRRHALRLVRQQGRQQQQQQHVILVR
ncbi:hypothetical protein BAE44_0002387 [Dichanthelium oligosanthes]|uniref:Uncharacterized protein n=1 Tax=Dichanthelium oligosanthes TaxID=888268 RepID=A0A1E5WGT5_9POAL|nr:hypothetical protein BAE44_0002387 [Dichanthelium oligosanthes]